QFEQHELLRIYPSSKFFGRALCTLERYRRFADFPFTAMNEFVLAFLGDDYYFGGGKALTRWLGLRLCTAASCVQGNLAFFEAYNPLVLGLVPLSLGRKPATVAEAEHFGLFEKIFEESRPQLVAETDPPPTRKASLAREPSPPLRPPLDDDEPASNPEEL